MERKDLRGRHSDGRHSRFIQVAWLMTAATGMMMRIGLFGIGRNFVTVIAAVMQGLSRSGIKAGERFEAMSHSTVRADKHRANE